LFDRTTRIVRITEAGLLFLEDAVRLIETMDYSIAALKDFAKSGRGRVTIACLSSAVYRLLPPVLAEMKISYPELDVVFLDDNMRGILQKMDKGECDIAIVSEDSERKFNISIPLLDDVFQVVCRSDHRLSLKNKISGTEISKHELVMLRRGSGIRDLLESEFEKKSIQINVVHETTQVLTLLGLVEANLGLTILPSMLCPDPSRGAFMVIPLEKPKIHRRLGLIFATGREPTAAARLLARVIQTTVLSQDFSIPNGVVKVVKEL
jgi:DNA-binding transcriptional LysR family regulator